MLVVPATADRWRDVEDLLPRAGGYPCWCQTWRRTARDYATMDRGTRRDALHLAMDEPPAPGVIAYAGAEAIGWSGFGPRSEMIRLARSTVVPRLSGPPYWSIVCFTIRPGHRTPEVARRLIDGVVDYARSQGAPGLEAYPVDIPAAEVPAGVEVEAAASYAGLASAFVAAGFRPASETRARAAGRPRILVRLDLEDAGG